MIEWEGPPHAHARNENFKVDMVSNTEEFKMKHIKSSKLIRVKNQKTSFLEYSSRSDQSKLIERLKTQFLQQFYFI